MEEGLGEITYVYLSGIDIRNHLDSYRFVYKGDKVRAEKILRRLRG